MKTNALFLAALFVATVLSAQPKLTEKALLVVGFNTACEGYDPGL